MSPYDVLGIQPGADKATIRAAYRRIAQIYHPDRFASADADVRNEAHRRMAEANRAYAELTTGRTQTRRSTWAPPPSGDDPFEEYFRERSWGTAAAAAGRPPSPSSQPTRQPLPRRFVDAVLIAFVLLFAIVAVLARSSPKSSAAKPPASPTKAVTPACPHALVVAVQPFTYRRISRSATYRVTLTGTVTNHSGAAAHLDVVTLGLLDDAGKTVHEAAAVPAITTLSPGQSTTWSADALVDSPHPPTRAHAELSYVLEKPPVNCTAESSLKS